MKILFIVNNFPLLSETFILNQITGLIDRGCDVDILANFKGGCQKVHENILKYDLLSRTIYYDDISQKIPESKFKRILGGADIFFGSLIESNLKTKLKAVNFFKLGRHAISLKPLYRMSAFSRRKPYDIAHCHFGPNGRLGLYLRDIGVVKGKVIVSFHGYDIGLYTRTHGIEAYGELFEKCDMITANSNFTINELKALGCKADKIVKIPMGLNTEKFRFQEKRLAPGENMNLLTVARLVEKKGIDFTIRALAEVVKKHQNIKYFIAGDGPLRGYLHELAVSLGLGNNIIFIGWQTDSDIVNLFSKCHVFILTSITTPRGDHEGQGLVLQEAQASGLPVICTRHNGFPESIVDGKSGFLVPEKDVNSISQKLLYLIENSDKWPEMGNAGRRHVRDHFDIDKLNDQLLRTYKHLN